jgi:hypothetical protein
MIIAVTVAIGLSVSTAACAPSDDADEASCSELVSAAARAVEPAEELRLLDEGLMVCGSYEAFAAELDQHPGALGYSVEAFIERRCKVTTDTEVRQSPTCLTAHPPTTPPSTTIVELVFVGTTVDGRLVEMRPTPEMPFIDDVPAEIQRTVDIALSEGCDGLRAQRDRWIAAVDGSASSDAASVFAQHAQNVATFTGCDIGTIEVSFVTVPPEIP